MKIFLWPALLKDAIPILQDNPLNLTKLLIFSTDKRLSHGMVLFKITSCVLKGIPQLHYCLVNLAVATPECPVISNISSITGSVEAVLILRPE